MDDASPPQLSPAAPSQNSFRAISKQLSHVALNMRAGVTRASGRAKLTTRKTRTRVALALGLALIAVLMVGEYFLAHPSLPYKFIGSEHRASSYPTTKIFLMCPATRVSDRWQLTFHERQVEEAIRLLASRAGSKKALEETELTVLVDSRANTGEWDRMGRTLQSWPGRDARLRSTGHTSKSADMWLDSISQEAFVGDSTPRVLFVTPNVSRDLMPNYLDWLREAMDNYGDHRHLPVAGFSPVLSNVVSKDPFLWERISIGAFAPIPSSWNLFREFFRAAVTDLTVVEWEPHLPELQGSPLTMRKRNRKQCLSILGPTYIDQEGSRFLPGLPKSKPKSVPSGDSARICVGRESVPYDTAFETFFSRFMHDYRLYVVYPGTSEAPLTRAANWQVYSKSKAFHKLETPFYRENQAEIEEIVAAARKVDHAVSLTVANSRFLPFAYSWWCNIQLGGFMPPGRIIWVTNDKLAEEGLQILQPSKVVFFKSLSGAEGKGADYKMAGYWSFMLSRTLLVRELLTRGIQVFLFDLDQVWLHNPWTFISPLLEHREWDLVGTRGYSKSEHGGEVQGNFLFLNPTKPTIALWHEVSDRFSAAYAKCCANVTPDTYVGGIEQDQFLLSHLVAFTSYKRIHKLKFIELDRHRFLDGKWYSDPLGNPKEQDPISIQNNWIVGSDNKIARAVKFRHWFWDNVTSECLTKNAVDILRVDVPVTGDDLRRHHIRLPIPASVQQQWSQGELTQR